jgi:nucleotide-binding universal stress UspA family protein
MIERILVPTDFSPSSYAALGYAVYLAGRLGSMVEVVHIVDAGDELSGTVPIVIEDGAPVPLAQVLRKRGEEAMTKFLADVPGSKGVSIKRRVELGKPAETTLELAQKERFDLVVMGTHGRTGLARMVVGSVAEKVIRGAVCAVLTVRVPD